MRSFFACAPLLVPLQSWPLACAPCLCPLLVPLACALLVPRACSLNRSSLVAPDNHHVRALAFAHVCALKRKAQVQTQTHAYASFAHGALFLQCARVFMTNQNKPNCQSCCATPQLSNDLHTALCNSGPLSLSLPLIFSFFYPYFPLSSLSFDL
jgi:hypothetical protein